jgi:uncharacterized protein DUF992
MRCPGARPRHGSGHGSGGRANEGRHAHLQHIARGRPHCRGTAATELHLCIGERQGARGLWGTVSTLGLDIGATSGGRLTWAVFAPTTLRRAALAGTYVGATAGGTVGAGVGANVLVGGSDRTVALQPVSVQAQTGLNIAAGVSRMELQPATAPARRTAQ